MSYNCPCCQKDVYPPSKQEQAEDMGDLFSCDHCQSVLKLEGGSLKVVFEGNNTETDLEEEVDTRGEEATEQEAIEQEATGEEATGEKATEQEATGEDSTPNEEEFKATNGGENELISQEVQSAVEEEPLSAGDLGISEEEILSEEGEGRVEQEGASDSIGELGEGEAPLENIATGEEGEASLDDNVVEQASDPSHELAEEGEKVMEEQDFSDVENYGNSTGADLKGFLRYDLFIEGIDSGEIKKQVFLILEDPRFNWSAKEIMQSEKEGVVVIKNLNPVKALCLVSELAFVSVDLSWKQYKAMSTS